jgi:outer membrane protein assembly factor BamB
MRHRVFVLAGAAALLVSGCRPASGSDDSGSGEETGDDDDPDENDDDDDDDDSDEGEDDDGMTKFDILGPPDEGGVPPPSCKVVDDMDAVGDCISKAPPESFEPEVQWGFWGEDGNSQAMSTPLVANLTDDNDDGEIDLCDVPDVVVGLFAMYGQWGGPLYALDGETGEMMWKSPIPVATTFTPVLGDIDDDGVPEIVAVTTQDQLVAFDSDGSLLWQGDVWPNSHGSLSMADVDNDGTPEIIGGNLLFDVDGSIEQTLPGNDPLYAATTAHDFDDDGDLEIILGNSAYHHDGGLLWSTNLPDGFPQVADLDDDGLPEVLLTNTQGLSVIEHDGTVKYQDLRPTGDNAGGDIWRRPACIHDFDGDGAPEYAMSSRNHFTAYEADGSILWSANVLDASGIAAGTAFDFLGDAVAEAMYADEHSMYVFDGAGAELLDVPRSSGTIVEYPTVADIDNDGSAEILIVSNTNWGNQTAPAIQAVRDVEDRWIQARRIWNQHAYHVTNVREDGTIPQFEQPHWELLNTFRTNAQIEAGGVCKPVPQG